MWWLALLVRWVLLAAAVALTAWVLPDVALEGGVWAALGVALLIGFANVVTELLVGLLPRPGSFWLLWLLVLAVNGLLVWGVAAVSSSLTVDGFVPAVGAAMLITVFSVALRELAVRLLPDDDSGRGAVAG
jgi:uncharacterized membrane protein YvlD (DUF360 family)